jgi:hypothetical protein
VRRKLGEDEELPNVARSLEEVAADIEKLTTLNKELQAKITLASEGDSGAPPDVETMTKSMIRLARANSALGKLGAYAKYIARNSERAYKAYRSERTLDLAKTMAVNRAELQAFIDSKEKFEIFSECQLLADEASDLSFRTDTFLEQARTRSSLIKGDVNRG